MQQLSKRSTDQIQSDITQLQRALNVPNLPRDEQEMHEALLKTLQLELGRRLNAYAAESPSAKPNSIQNAGFRQPPPTRQREEGATRIIFAGGHTQTDQQINSRIEFSTQADKHNPVITITWSDGYQISVDETAASGRFKSTLRDTIALKCVSVGRYQKMWRWDTPWRCAGFYRALIAFWENQRPSLRDLGFTRATAKELEVFALIAEKSESNEFSTSQA